LVEMLLVVAIIGLLIGILLPTVIGVTQESKITHVRGDLRTLLAAIEKYAINHNAYPSDTQSDNAVVVDASVLEQLLQAEDPQLVRKVPEDPFSTTGAKYKYVVNNFDDATSPATGRPTFVIWSVGPLNSAITVTSITYDPNTNSTTLTWSEDPDTARIIYETNANFVTP